MRRFNNVAIRRVIECDICDKEITGDYIVLNVKKYNPFVEFGLNTHFFVCASCQERLTSIIKRLNAKKKRSA